MMPYSWMWSPQVHLPFSGNVTQDILPDTRWFFGAIRPGAGIGSIEKDVFEVASYGKQLGLILDVLMPLIGEADSEKSERSKVELKALYHKIEQLKADKKDDIERAAVALLSKLEQADPEMVNRVVSRFDRSK
jgi:hypothetical protein